MRIFLVLKFRTFNILHHALKLVNKNTGSFTNCSVSLLRLITFSSTSHTMASKAAEPTFIEVDGSMLEGGGQILRNCAALSCLLRKPIKVNNIRAGRSKPGLRPQHLTGLMLINELCGGKLTGDCVGSTEITFHPGKVSSGTYNADTGTAGSTCLLMQAAIPCLLCGSGPTVLNLRGGTNAEMAPQIDYFSMIFKPVAKKFGLEMDIAVKRRGYFPKGGGEVVTTSYPAKCLNAVTMMDPGRLIKITGRSFVAGVLPIKVAKIMEECAVAELKQCHPDIPIEIEVLKEPSQTAVGTGTGIILIAHTSTGCLMAGSALGKKGVAAEKVGQAAADSLLDNLFHGGCVDDFLQDQLIILMALAKGTSKIKCGPLSLHTQTAIHVATLMTSATFNVQELSKTSTIIECEGIGLTNDQL